MRVRAIVRAIKRLAGIGGWLALACVVILIAVGYPRLKSWFEKARPDMSVEREDDGRVITKIIDGELQRTSDLRVSRLSGVVQATASDSQMWGWLPATYVMKAPFSVSYFVELRALDRSKFFWNAKDRTLTVLVPDVVPEQANVDQSRILFELTDGMFVSRAAMARLRTRASGKALVVARQEALKPTYFEAARQNGRQMIARLYTRPLRIAGVNATVQVRFEGEPERNPEQIDRSRSLAEIFGG